MIRLYNTLTRQVEEFAVPDKKIRMFVCGPTVYDYSHLGHARTYVLYDAFVRYLRYSGYQVFYLQNITDIDDKIIARAHESGKDPLELARELTTAHYQDMEALGVTSVDKYAPATAYIPQILSQVKRLIDKGAAYRIENDGYYFDLTKFSDYGKLSGRTVEAAEDAVSRIDESINKRNKGDFALWKFSKSGEPSWDFETGAYLGISDGGPAFAEASAGKPGWHIEDTAITETEFGPQYDLHGGALELIFPHHEAEIAQMETISGKVPMVKHWMHTGVLTIGGKKMAKSLGNSVTIREILKKYSPEVVRFYLLSGLYRAPLDFDDTALRAAEAAVQRISELTYKKSDVTLPADTAIQAIQEALDDDFNTTKAFAALFEFIKEANVKHAIPEQKFFDFLSKIFGIVPSATASIAPEVQQLVQERERARQEKDFSRADQLRKQIESLGYRIDDTPYGPLVNKLKK